VFFDVSPNANNDRRYSKHQQKNLRGSLEPPTAALLHNVHCEGTMPSPTLHHIHSEHDQPPVMPAEFQPLMQSLLATLADIDLAHEHELEKVNSTSVDNTFKAKLITKLDQVHREKRHPYANELLNLEARARSFLGRGS
jgi:hypothetical protein